MKRLLPISFAACMGCNLLVEPSPKFGAAVGATDDLPPSQPEWLLVHTAGDPDDVPLDGIEPGLLLAGAYPVDDDALRWLSERSGGGDVVVLQSQGMPQLGDHLYDEIGGFDSVQTLILPSSTSTNDPWVSWTIDHAEVVLLVGDDPQRLWWKGSALADALARAWERGAVLGGVDAGSSVLGEFAFTAEAGPLSSDEVLEDPYVPSLTLGRAFVSLPPLAGCLLEPDFVDADRMGRLLGLAARVQRAGWADEVIGVGIDHDASLVIDADGLGEVIGKGHVYLARVDRAADVCAPELPLELGPIDVLRLSDGQRVSWPGGIGDEGQLSQVSTKGGSTEPPNPY